MKNQKGTTLQADDLIARVVKVGTIKSFWAVSIWDNGIQGFHRLDDGGPWHGEPTEEAAKGWAEKYLQQQTAQNPSSLIWAEF
jgi:hypothetical protein